MKERTNNWAFRDQEVSMFLRKKKIRPSFPQNNDAENIFYTRSLRSWEKTGLYSSRLTYNSGGHSRGKHTRLGGGGTSIAQA